MKIKKILSLLVLLSILITSVPNSSFANEPTVISRAYTDESKFTFDKSTNTITKFTGDETEVTIPETIGGVPVKIIGSKDSKIQGEKLKEIINENIVLKIEPVEKEKIKTIKSLENKYVDVFDIYLKNMVTDKAVKLPNGNYKITLPKRAGQTVVVVYYLDADKNITNHKFTQDDAKNIVTFETTHLSKYVIEYKVVQDNGNNTTDNTTDNTSGTTDNTNNNTASTTTESSNGSQKLAKTNIVSTSLLVTVLFGFGAVIVSKKKR